MPTTNSRTAWSLLEIDALAKNETYAAAAKRNLDWTLAQQHENGWYENNAFFTDSKWSLPLTHTIAYVMEGLIESWRLTGVRHYFDAAHKTAEKLMRIFELRRYLAGEFDKSWKTSAKYSCLAGDAQVAGVWLRLFRAKKDTRFTEFSAQAERFRQGIAESAVAPSRPARRGQRLSSRSPGRLQSCTVRQLGREVSGRHLDARRETDE